MVLHPSAGPSNGSYGGGAAAAEAAGGSEAATLRPAAAGSGPRQLSGMGWLAVTVRWVRPRFRWPKELAVEESI